MLRNTYNSWGFIARAFHWITALMIVGLFFYGLYIHDFIPREERAGHYTIHASVGISLLALLVLRVLWRVVNPTPRPPRDASKMMIGAAHLGHFGLYLLAFAAATAGWLVAGSGRASLDYYLFGVVPMPSVLGLNSPYHRDLEEAHEFLAWALIALVVVHVAAAIWHQIVRKDGILARMTSGKPSASV